MTLRENITNELRSSILSSVYKPGDRLTEAALALRFGVSRTPIREALNRLEKEGFIKITPDKGASVIKLSSQDISDIYDMLFALDGLGCSLACANLTDQQINDLEQVHFAMVKATSKKNLDVIYELNIQFHEMIMKATDNPYLIDTHRNFRGLLNQFQRISYLAPGQCAATLTEHRKMIDAFKTRNPALADLLVKDHIQGAKKRIIEYLHKKGIDSKTNNHSRDMRKERRRSPAGRKIAQRSNDR